MATFAEQMVEKLQAILLANAGLASVSVDSRDGRAGGPGGEAGSLAGQGQPRAWHGSAGGDDQTWGAERMIASRLGTIVCENAGCVKGFLWLAAESIRIPNRFCRTFLMNVSRGRLMV